jgi:hypothetical protein
LEKQDKKIITFSVEDIEIESLEEINGSQFAHCRLKAFSDGMTSHRYTFTEEVLKSAESTILYKPLLWKYNMLTDDANQHDEDEQICGLVPNLEDANITYEVDEETGKLFMCFNAFLWKLYSGSLLDIFNRTDGLKKVSVELWIIDSIKHDEDNTEEVLKFCYTGVTILGERIKEACQNAKIQITKFSDITDVYESELLYSSIDFTIPKSIKNTVTFALELDENSNRKNKSIANYLLNSDKIDISKIKYIVNNYKKNTLDLESKGYWGDNECFDWCKKLLNSVNSIQTSINIHNESKKEEDMSKKILENSAKNVDDTKIDTPEIVVNSDGTTVFNSDELTKVDNAEQYIHTRTVEEVDVSLYDDKGNYIGSSSEYNSKSTTKIEEITEEEAQLKVETVLNSDDSEVIDYKAKFAEMELKCSALETEKTDLQIKYSTLELKCSTLEAYKNNKENELKVHAVECAIDEVTDILSAEQLIEWRNKSVNCTDVNQFKNELKAFAFDIQKNSGLKPQHSLRNAIPKQTQVTSDNVWDRLASL